MLRYMLRRLVYTLGTLAAVSVVAFLVIQLPSSPSRAARSTMTR